MVMAMVATTTDRASLMAPGERTGAPVGDAGAGDGDGEGGGGMSNNTTDIAPGAVVTDRAPDKRRTFRLGVVGAPHHDPEYCWVHWYGASILRPTRMRVARLRLVTANEMATAREVGA